MSLDVDDLALTETSIKFNKHVLFQMVIDHRHLKHNLDGRHETRYDPDERAPSTNKSAISEHVPATHLIRLFQSIYDIGGVMVSELASSAPVVSNQPIKLVFVASPQSMQR